MAQGAFDIQSIPQATLDDIKRGLETEEQALADTICTLESRRTSLSGNFPLDESVFGLARITDTGLAPGEEADDQGGRMGSQDFHCLAFVGTHRVYNEELIDRSRFNNSEDVGGYARKAKAVANAKVDAKLANVLADTVVNNEFDVTTDGTGAWDAAGNPLADLNKITRTFAPNADTAILGRNVYDALVGNSNIIANTSLFDSGQIDYDALLSLLRVKIRGLRQVYVFDKMVNNAPIDGAGNTPPGAPNVEFARLFEDGMWVGHKKALIMVRPTHRLQDQMQSQYIVRKRRTDLQYERYIDIVRPFKEMGCTITNILT